MRRILSIILVIVGVLFFSLWGGCKKKEENKLTIETKPITEIATNSAKCGGIVTAIGNYTIGACGVCWSETPSPTLDNLFTTDFQGVGEFTSLMKDLKPSTKYYVRAYATTSSGIMYGEELNFSTEAAATADITVYTNEIVEITSSSARCGGVVVSNGSATVTQRGVCWSTTSNPTVSGCRTEDGQGAGSFSSTMTSLSENTRYFVRAYAVTDDGALLYGDEKQFTSASGGADETVVVYTSEVTEITSSGAKCGGAVSVTGNVNITARGVCWSTSPDPTVNGSHTSDGQGSGSFASDVTGLTASTPYYIRAYATTSAGNTIYGDSKTFTTESGNANPTLPTVTIVDVTDITGSSARCSGKVVSEGNASVTERGYCWNTSSNPMVYHSHVSCGSGSGEFEGQLTGLEEGTTYHVRAYATNSEGTNYSEEITFETNATTISEAWLYYDDGRHDTDWGYLNGGELEWAVMFPSNSLSQYDGMAITKISIYASVIGNHTIKLYKGGSSAPSVEILSGYSDLTHAGWWDLSLVTPVALTTTQNLWLSVTKEHEAGEYPAASSVGSNNPNARWINWGSNGWSDAYLDEWSDEDITWMLRVYLTSDVKGKEMIELIPSSNCDSIDSGNSSKGTKVTNAKPTEGEIHEAILISDY